MTARDHNDEPDARGGARVDDARLDAAFAQLADVPPPRRTDDAFARSVSAGVRARRRTGALVVLPTLAAAAAALAFVVARPGPEDGATPRAPIASAAQDVALADPFDDDSALFALPLLEGSSDEELARLDAVLDRKLSAQRGAR